MSDFLKAVSKFSFYGEDQKLSLCLRKRDAMAEMLCR